MLYGSQELCDLAVCSRGSKRDEHRIYLLDAPRCRWWQDYLPCHKPCISPSQKRISKTGQFPHQPRRRVPSHAERGKPSQACRAIGHNNTTRNPSTPISPSFWTRSVNASCILSVRSWQFSLGGRDNTSLAREAAFRGEVAASLLTGGLLDEDWKEERKISDMLLEFWSCSGASATET